MTWPVRSDWSTLITREYTRDYIDEIAEVIDNNKQPRKSRYSRVVNFI